MFSLNKLFIISFVLNFSDQLNRIDWQIIVFVMKEFLIYHFHCNQKAKVVMWAYLKHCWGYLFLSLCRAQAIVAN